MISVLIRVENGVEALAATLTALVPAVAEGLVGDAVVLVRDNDPAVATVADAVGAHLLVEPEGSWTRAADLARRDWLLCLEDGDVPSEGWIRTLDRFIALSPPSRRFGRLSRRPAHALGGLQTALLSWVQPRRIRAGDLVHRTMLQNEVLQRPARVGAVIERDPVFS